MKEAVARFSCCLHVGRREEGVKDDSTFAGMGDKDGVFNNRREQV